MALICMAVHDTEENGRSEYTDKTIRGLMESVDFKRHKLFISDNNSCQKTKALYGILKALPNMPNGWITIHYNDKNLGTAAAINQCLRNRFSDLNSHVSPVCIKMDNDVVVHQSGWVEELEQAISERPDIGILGLKRDDVTGEFTEDGKFLFGDDIMGTCTAFNLLLLDKVGYMQQPSTYGFDDVLMSARSLAAGFKNAFLPHIKITHLDDGKNPYCDWKKKEAGVYLQEVGHMCEMIKSGQLNYYYDGE